MAREKELTRVQELIYEMKVAQVMTTDVVIIHPTARMRNLQSLLRDKRISGVPVMEDDQLVGLISMEDFIKCLVGGKMDSLVKELMSREVKTLYDSDLLVHAVEEFDRRGYGRFPVVTRQTQ
jgi:predicted transcriptional regulator